MTTIMSNYELYGGAITINLPENLIDASFAWFPPCAPLATDRCFRDLRQVPDAQEVFLDRNSDMSFIFEILNRVEPEDPSDAAR